MSTSGSYMLSPLTEEEIASILENYQSMPLGIDLEADFRISLAGAQEKTALLYHAGHWCRPAGATPTSHLFKLPIGELGRSGIDLSASIENEWLCRADTGSLWSSGCICGDEDLRRSKSAGG